MGKISNKTLIIESYSTKIDKAKDFIQGRAEGKHRSLTTSFTKLNKALFQGFEWGRIVTIAGLSGAGKSVMLSQIRRDFVDYNPMENIKILSFEMEMSGVDQVSRDISSKVELSTKQLYSAEDDSILNQDQLDSISRVADSMKYYPIYVVDEIGNVKEIIQTILDFVETEQIAEKDIGLVLTWDHSLMIRTDDNDSEKEIVDYFYRSLVWLKKHFESIGVRSLMIVLSQLNRSIESTERVANIALQYPNKTDLFGSSAAFYCSDVVIVTHKPKLIDGIGEYYGPRRGEKYPFGLPTLDPITKQPMIYWHIIKSRFSTNQILMMVDDFVNSRILEYLPSD